MNSQETSAPSAEAADIVLWARDVAERYLEPLGRRWTHVQCVAARAAEVGWLVGPDSPTLIAAAYLHDIGYAPALVQSGFHPLDGARFVQGHGHDRIARLVAHHTGARVEAVLRGLDRALEGFPSPTRSWISCSLTAT
jgi:HD superfamily phosphodiesterase